MKQHNDSHIKKIFEEHEVLPSKMAWNKLSDLLDRQLPLESDNQLFFVSKKAKNYKSILDIAAVFLFAFGLVFWTLKTDEKNTTNLVVNSPNENKFNTQIPLESETDFYLEDIIKKTPSNNLVEKKLKSEIVHNNTLEVKIPIINQEVDVLTNDSVLIRTIPKAQKQIHIAWEPVKNKEIEIDTRNLIRSVERELIQDRAAEQLDKSKDRFEQIKFAIFNRNYEE